MMVEGEEQLMMVEREGDGVGIARRGKGDEEGLLKVEGCYRGRIIACRGRTRWC